MSTEAPKRAAGSFTITMGLMSIPLNVYTGTEVVTIARSQYLEDGTVVGQAPCVKIGEGVYGDKVDKALIVKRYQTSSGLVDLSDDEIAACATAVPGTADVLAVHSAQLLRDGVYLTNGKVWQVRAAGLGSGRAKKPNPGGEQALALLLTAMRVKDCFMLLRWSREGSVYVGALLPTGRLLGLYHDEEVRAERDLPFADQEFPDNILEMAGSLLNAYTEDKPVPLVNETVAAVSAYAELKARDGVVFTPAAESTNVAPVIDIMAQLAASVLAVTDQRKADADAVPRQPLPSEVPANVDTSLVDGKKKRAPRKATAKSA